MNDFWYRFKNQPWKDLGLASALTITIAAIVEVLLGLCYGSSKVCHDSLLYLFAPPFSSMLILAAGVGVGALAVYLCENWERVAGVSLNIGTLWALVLCLMVAIVLKSLLLQQVIAILSLNQIGLMGIMVGVFWKGRAYWR